MPSPLSSPRPCNRLSHIFSKPRSSSPDCSDSVSTNAGTLCSTTSRSTLHIQSIHIPENFTITSLSDKLVPTRFDGPISKSWHGQHSWPQGCGSTATKSVGIAQLTKNNSSACITIAEQVFRLFTSVVDSLQYNVEYFLVMYIEELINNLKMIQHILITVQKTKLQRCMDHTDEDAEDIVKCRDVSLRRTELSQVRAQVEIFLPRNKTNTNEAILQMSTRILWPLPVRVTIDTQTSAHIR